MSKKTSKRKSGHRQHQRNITKYENKNGNRIGRRSEEEESNKKQCT